MYHTIKGGKSASALRVDMDHGERLYVARQSLIAGGNNQSRQDEDDEPNLLLTSTHEGGMLRDLANKFGKKAQGYGYDILAAHYGPAWVMLAPPSSFGGTAITAIELYESGALLFRETAFLAAQDSLTFGSTLPRDIAAAVGPAMAQSHINPLFAAGEGLVFLTATGGIETLLVQEGQSMRIDAAHLMAWDSSVTIAPLKTSLFKKTPPMPWGENKILLDVSGRGRVWVHTCTPIASRG